MKAYKKYLALLVTAVVMLTVCACGNTEDANITASGERPTLPESSVISVIVTNESGEPVTDEDGSTLTETITVTQAQSTAALTDAQGEPVTDASGSTLTASDTTAAIPSVTKPTTGIQSGTTAKKGTTTTTKTTTTARADSQSTQTATTTKKATTNPGGNVSIVTTTKPSSSTTKPASSTTKPSSSTTLPNLPAIDSEVLRISDSSYLNTVKSNIPYDEFGITGSAKTSLQSNPSSWKAYTVTASITNSTGHDITVYGLKDSGSGKDGIYIGKSGDSVMGIPATNKSPVTMSFNVLVSDPDIAESVILNTIKEDGLELCYAATNGYDDTQPVEFQYVTLR